MENINISLENIIDNIYEKKFKKLNSNLFYRVENMRSKGWVDESVNYEIVIPNINESTSVNEIYKNPNDSDWNYIEK